MSSPAPKAVSVSIFDSENRTLCDISAPIKDVHPANAVIAMTVITFDISIVNGLDYMVLIVNLKIFLYFVISFLWSIGFIFNFIFIPFIVILSIILMEDNSFRITS